MFLYADDFSSIEKTGKEITGYLVSAIDEVGLSNVIQVVTNNVASCKLAGKEVQQVHKHIFSSPFVVHTLNLIFKDIAKTFDWFWKTYQIGKGIVIVKYILNHQHTYAIFRDQSKLKLLKVVKTRFASHYILLRSMTC